MLGKKVLIIDDDADLRQVASLIFKKVGAQVMTASDGLDGFSKLFTFQPDLIVLDVMMPGNDGFDICQRIRQVSNAPLIMLTALNQEQEMLLGLNAGADDFLSKPFNPDILVARARTILRRMEASNGDNGTFNYNDGRLSIDIEKHHVVVNGKRVKLTPLEFRLLVFLARNAGKVLTFEKILTHVWGADYEGSMDYVHVYISHLRRKIEEDVKSPRYLLTIHGIGYIFEKPELSYKFQGF
ncbi:MAG: response regulator transcription factor [Chloroflexota bacterium]